MVFSGPSGNVGLLRSVDRRRGNAVDHHDRIDGLSLRRFESVGKWLLHDQTETLLPNHVWLGLFDVDPFDRDRNFYPRTGLDLVLAGTNMGSQRGGVRQERRSARHDRHQQNW